MIQKKFGSEQIWVQNKFLKKKILGLKNFVSEKNVRKCFWVQPNILFKFCLGPIKLWSSKFWALIDFGSEKPWVQKISGSKEDWSKIKAIKAPKKLGQKRSVKIRSVTVTEILLIWTNVASACMLQGQMSHDSWHL